MQIDLWRWQQRIKPLVFPTLLGLFLLYTANQLFYGERGIVTWRVMQTQNAQLRTDIEDLKADIARLERDIDHLKPKKDSKGRLYVDDDFLDELARRDLSLLKPGDQVILTSPSALGSAR